MIALPSSVALALFYSRKNLLAVSATVSAKSTFVFPVTRTSLPDVAPSTQYPVVISSFVFNKVVILLLVSRRSIETPTSVGDTNANQIDRQTLRDESTVILRWPYLVKILVLNAKPNEQHITNNQVKEIFNGERSSGGNYEVINIQSLGPSKLL